jgi:hypothetical protein
MEVKARIDNEIATIEQALSGGIRTFGTRVRPYCFFLWGLSL